MNPEPMVLVLKLRYLAFETFHYSGFRARARIRSFEHDRDFIEHEHHFLIRSSK
jgi:hypothetical protein